ncbi:NDP-hexose 2,3-dehydratase family protein [Streptomyces sp. NPDC058221]|uniref:NDP-hexose 2,3-dehydratase family protein n=1 Tax=Streptomyces sp. NPDC058221 TaxID=3346388 RepID=UPI0036E52184
MSGGYDIPAALRESATTRYSASEEEAVLDWFAARNRSASARIREVPLSELQGWSIAPETGNLRHDSGKFFSVGGIAVKHRAGTPAQWTQPIIHQPEVGVLGILVRVVDGALQCLMQAKLEPGNHNGVQLSPTVQATRSNYQRVHGGFAVPYLEHFFDAPPHRTLVDVLQSEHASWCHRKRNRNMVVLVDEDVEVREGFRWFTVGQIHQLLARDGLVNMCSRTVLACLLGCHAPRDDTPGAHSTAELLRWVNATRAECTASTDLIPFTDIEGWDTPAGAAAQTPGRTFDIVGVDVKMGDREVAQWNQPLLRPRKRGIAAFIVKPVRGIPHALVHARFEPGNLQNIELSPTVEAADGAAPAGERPLFLDDVLRAPRERRLFDTEMAEEGGRYMHARSRHLVVAAQEDDFTDTPQDYRWISLPQMSRLLRHSHYWGISARSLIGCLHALNASAVLG